MKKLLALVLTLSTCGVAYADGLLAPKTPQVIEIAMPDGHKEQGLIQDGKFIPIVQPTPQAVQSPDTAAKQQPQTPQSAQHSPISGQASYVAPVNANVHVDETQHLDQTQHVDTNQNIHSNNYNVNRQDHDKMDTITGYGNLFLHAVGILGSLGR
jgi:hypothetical protein